MVETNSNIKKKERKKKSKKNKNVLFSADNETWNSE